MHKLFMHWINTLMKTYTAMIRANVNGSTRVIPTQVRAKNPIDAKWLLQAIYGFHAVISTPTELQVEAEIAEEKKLRTPDQIRIDNLNAAKDRASNALKAERDRQSRQRAMKRLSKPTLKLMSTIK